MFCRCRVLRAKDPFKVLGLTRTATKVQVKTKYRELARLHHPDAQHGDAVKMEEINRAYNLLMKEGAFERLHLSSVPRGPSPSNSTKASGASSEKPSDGQAAANIHYRHPSPFSSADMVDEKEDYAKVSALNAETERVTPEGKFMYQNRDSGEWITLDKPLIRANQPRYKSFSQVASQELQEDLRRRRDEQERAYNARTAFDRVADRLRDGSHLPLQNRYGLAVAALVVMITAHFVYKKSRAFKDHKELRRQFYVDLDEERKRSDDLYVSKKLEVESLVAAAALVFMIAAEKKRLSDPIISPRVDEHYNCIRPPKDHFEIVSGN